MRGERDENETGYIGKRTHRLKASAAEVVSVYSRIYAVMETPDSRRERGVREGATRHEDEMDGDKASALDVYLRFKLSPARPEERKFCRSLIFSLESLDFFFFNQRRSEKLKYSCIFSLIFFLLYKGNYNLLLRLSERQHSFETACTSVISLQGSIFAWRSVFNSVEILSPRFSQIIVIYFFKNILVNLSYIYIDYRFSAGRLADVDQSRSLGSPEGFNVAIT